MRGERLVAKLGIFIAFGWTSHCTGAWQTENGSNHKKFCNVVNESKFDVKHETEVKDGKKGIGSMCRRTGLAK